MAVVYEVSLCGRLHLDATVWYCDPPPALSLGRVCACMRFSPSSIKAAGGILVKDIGGAIGITIVSKQERLPKTSSTKLSS